MKPSFQSFVVLCVSTFCLLATSLEARTWKSANGKFTCQALFVRFLDEQTIIIERQSDGKELTIKVKDLSKEDQRYLKRKWERLHPKEPEDDEEDDAPPEPKPSKSSPRPRPDPRPDVSGKPEPGAHMQALQSRGPVYYIGLVICGISTILSLVGAIMVLIQAFKESVAWGVLCLFCCSLGLLIFAITHWEQSKKGFLIWLAGFVLGILGRFLMEI